MGRDIRQGSRDWSRNLWEHIKALFSGLDTRVTALEQGGGGGGGAVSGVKGDAELTYRTGNVNLTAANIGAKAVQTAVSDPTASGTGLTFIDSITQDAQGVITPTKKTVQTATQSADGIMSSTDKAKLDGIAAGAEVNSITGVKGNAESSYRTGNVNLTPANIGAAPASDFTIYEVQDWHQFTPGATGQATKRKYGYSTSASVLNKPLTGTCTLFGWSEGWNNYYSVHVVVHYSDTPEWKNAEFNCYYQNGTWTQWVRVSAYPSVLKQITSNSSYSFNIPAYGRCRITVMGYSSESIGEWLFARTNTTSGFILKTIASASDISITMDSSGNVTVSNNYVYDVQCKVEQIYKQLEF